MLFNPLQCPAVPRRGSFTQEAIREFLNDK